MPNVLGTTSTLSWDSSTAQNISHTISVGTKMVLIFCIGWDSGLGANPTYAIDHDGNLDIETEIPGAATRNTSGGQFTRVYRFDEDHADWPASLPDTSNFNVGPSGSVANRVFIVNLDEKVVRDSDVLTGSSAAFDFPGIDSSVNDLVLMALAGWDSGDPLTNDDGSATEVASLVGSGVDAWIWEMPGAATTKTVGGDANSSISFAGAVLSIQGSAPPATGKALPRSRMNTALQKHILGR